MKSISAIQRRNDRMFAMFEAARVRDEINALEASGRLELAKRLRKQLDILEWQAMTPQRRKRFLAARQAIKEEKNV